MAVFHQMGHHSANLIDNPSLGAYEGAILSPVNYSEEDVKLQIESHLRRPGFQSILDPQLYAPQTSRQRLRDWRHFPADVDTADQAADDWWDGCTDVVAQLASDLRPSAVCSPAVLYRAYSEDYFKQLARSADRLHRALRGSGTRVLQTIVVNMSDLTSAKNRNEIASILTQSDLTEAYLVLVSGVDPRREHLEEGDLLGTMRLIGLLEQEGMQLLVGYSSTDGLLWKAAGASHCASGKFFNLRRFTKTRFEEPGGGGGQLPYFTEHSLSAFLRESDLLRIERAGLISSNSRRNPATEAILECVHSGRPWLALSWQQYLWWFADTEAALASGRITTDQVLQDADACWTELDRLGVLMDERSNDGRWVRRWRQVLTAFRRPE